MIDTAVKTRKAPQQARAKARIDTILTATNGLLKTTTPANITTTMIAHAAGIPVGSLYRYFEDKNAILEQLYSAASHAVFRQVETAQAAIDAGTGFEEVIRLLLQDFWRAAREHPTFKALTRWANREHSFVDVTPGTDSGLAEMVARTFKVTDLNVPAAREAAVMQTTVTIVSALIDVAFEEENEDAAQALIDELATLLTRYLR